MRPLLLLYTSSGADGVELLTTCMNSYFTQVISCIDAHEGDVVKFAGGRKMTWRGFSHGDGIVAWQCVPDMTWRGF